MCGAFYKKTGKGDYVKIGVDKTDFVEYNNIVIQYYKIYYNVILGGLTMAKQTISITLEPQTVETIRKIAAEELRTVSNMIDYIVSQYAIKKTETNFSKHARAAIFGEHAVIRNFADTQKILKNNVHVDKADSVFIKSLQGEEE